MSSFISQRSTHNDALKVNRPNANRNLSVHGSNWLWAVTGVVGVAFLSWLVWTLLRNKKAQSSVHETRKHSHDNTQNGNHAPSAATDYGTTLRKERVFHYLWTIAAFITFIAYYSMASDLGNTPVRQYKNHGNNPEQTRQVFYVRYIYWITAWPLVIIANLLLSGVSWATILFAVALQEIWIVSWLAGALTRTSYKWGYFAFGTFAYLILAYILVSWGIEHAKRIRTSKEYTVLALLLVVTWAAYPVAWGLSEGANKLSVTGENVFYGILDLIAIPIYGTLFLIFTRRFNPSLFTFTQYGRVRAVDDARTPVSGHHAGNAV